MCDAAVVVANPLSPRDAFTMAGHSLAELAQRVAAEPVEDVRHWWARRYWATRNRRASIVVDAG